MLLVVSTPLGHAQVVVSGWLRALFLQKVCIHDD
jgi:hypothetical protein